MSEKRYVNQYHKKIEAIQLDLLNCPEIKKHGYCYNEIPPYARELYPEIIGVFPDYGFYPDFPRIVMLLRNPGGGAGEKGLKKWIEEKYPNEKGFPSHIYSEYLESEPNWRGFDKFNLYTGHAKKWIFNDAQYSLPLIIEYCFGNLIKSNEVCKEERNKALIKRITYLNLVHCPGRPPLEAPHQKQINLCANLYLNKILKILEPHFIFAYGNDVSDALGSKVSNLKVLYDIQLWKGDERAYIAGLYNPEDENDQVYIAKYGQKKTFIIINYHPSARISSKDIENDLLHCFKVTSEIWQKVRELNLG